LTFSGSYEQLYTYVTFAVVLFHAATGAAVLVLRRRLPDAPRPYRVWGYPWVPLVFVLSSAGLVLNTLVEKPRESALGLGLLLLGIPAYLWWRRRAATAAGGPDRRA
jgi:APA family basic amino acid/polyamine antiporter